MSAIAALAAVIIAACGSGSSGDSESEGAAGQAGVVLDSAPTVESAVVDSTTTTAVPETTAAPATTAVPETTAAPDTTAAPATTEAPAPTQAPDTTATTGSSEPVSTGVPVGYRPIFDESGGLRANVPAEWVQTDGVPDGEILQLAASADLPGFLASYTVPGMLLVSAPAVTPDAWEPALATTLSSSADDGCTVSETSEYDDGVYTGTEHVLACGSDATVAHLIGGRDSEGELFFLLAIVRPADDPSVRDEIVQSFFFD